MALGEDGFKRKCLVNFIFGIRGKIKSESFLQFYIFLIYSLYDRYSYVQNVHMHRDSVMTAM